MLVRRSSSGGGSFRAPHLARIACLVGLGSGGGDFAGRGEGGGKKSLSDLESKFRGITCDDTQQRLRSTDDGLPFPPVPCYVVKRGRWGRKGGRAKLKGEWAQHSPRRK